MNWKYLEQNKEKMKVSEYNEVVNRKDHRSKKEAIMLSRKDLLRTAFLMKQ